MGLGGTIIMIGDAAAPRRHFGRAALEPRSAFHGEGMGGGFACPNQGAEIIARVERQKPGRDGK